MVIGVVASIVGLLGGLYKFISGDLLINIVLYLKFIYLKINLQKNKSHIFTLSSLYSYYLNDCP